jgi:hypothetical protein
MNMPNFLIIGAAKAGSTSLHYILDQHPEIYMCPMKEPSFFWAYNRKIELIGPGAEVMKHRYVDNLIDYRRLFDGVTYEKAIGESSVRYLSDLDAPIKIKEFIPDGKLIAILRQPAERAFSSFIHYRRDGMEPCEHFIDAIKQEKQGLRDNWTFGRYLNEGFYFQALNRYLDYFDRSQLYITLMEDFQTDPKIILSNIFGFLAVDQKFSPDTSHRHNPSGIIRNPLLRFLWINSNRLRSWIRPIFPERLSHRVFELLVRNVEKPAFDPGFRAELTNFYRKDIEKLQELLQRDLSHWLQSY